MSEIPSVPDVLSRQWSWYWPGADVPALAAEVRARMAEAVAAWRLEDVRRLDGGNVAFVCAATRAGRPVVVKATPNAQEDVAELAVEGAALEFWRLTGAVPAVLGRRDEGLTLLMERVVPGTALDASGMAWDDALLVLGRLAARLHAAGAPPAEEGFLPVARYARYWWPALADDPARLAELDVLVAGGDEVLVHFDLHGGNALSDGDRWIVIDPKGVRADRHADTWALIDPLVPALPADPAAAARLARDRVLRYARAADLDPGRAGAWTRVRARAEALTIERGAEPFPEDLAWAARLHRTADALASQD